jgi:predicted transcriptional regulator
VETLIKGKPNTFEEEIVLEIDQKVKIGDRELSCVLVQVTVDSVGGVKTVRKEWRTDEIPGGVARREARQYLNGKELDSALSQMEVVRFRAKR